MFSPAAVVSDLWLIWVLGWLGASVWTAKTVARQSPASQLAYAIFIWIGAALLFFHLTLVAPFQVDFLPNWRWIAWQVWAWFSWASDFLAGPGFTSAGYGAVPSPSRQSTSS